MLMIELTAPPRCYAQNAHHAFMHGGVQRARARPRRADKRNEKTSFSSMMRERPREQA